MATSADWIHAAGANARGPAVIDLVNQLGAILFAPGVVKADAVLALSGLIVSAADAIGEPEPRPVAEAIASMALQAFDRREAVACADAMRGRVTWRAN